LYIYLLGGISIVDIMYLPLVAAEKPQMENEFGKAAQK